jgi:hypothetical protein
MTGTTSACTVGDGWGRPTISERKGRQSAGHRSRLEAIAQTMKAPTPPPHFHTLYAENKARCSIDTGEIIDGELPPRAARVVREWAALHRAELEENWRRCERRVPLSPAEPLQ